MDIFLPRQELREKADQLVEDIRQGKSCIITEQGRASAVLLSIDHYNAMLDALEAIDEEDLDSGKDLAKVALAWKRLAKPL